MKKETIRILTFAAALLLAGTALAGEAVWISDKGEEHKIGANAIFLDDDGEFFDLSELEDGETRVFGSGEKQITARRDGDTISIERPEGEDERAIQIQCEAGRDTCKVMTFGEGSEKVALMIKKRHPGHHVMTIDEDVMVGEDGEATIVIQQIGDCDADADCLKREIEVLADSGHTGHHRMIAEGATRHDLSELFDGETRIFGYGEKQVTVVRQGDKVSISRPQRDDEDEALVTCTIGEDLCEVLTYGDDPEKVAIVIAKSLS